VLGVISDDFESAERRFVAAGARVVTHSGASHGVRADAIAADYQQAGINGLGAWNPHALAAYHALDAVDDRQVDGPRAGNVGEESRHAPALVPAGFGVQFLRHTLGWRHLAIMENALADGWRVGPYRRNKRAHGGRHLAIQESRGD